MDRSLRTLQRAHAPRILSYPSARRVYRAWVQSHGYEPAPHLGQHSIEHVVPQKLLRSLKDAPLGDMHNFLLYPARLNSARGHQRMADERDVLACLQLLDAPASALRAYDALGFPASTHLEQQDDNLAWDRMQLPPGHAWSFNDHFVPPTRLRGRIARAVAYMAYQYPKLQLLQGDVLDQHTMVEWHREHPVTQEEHAAEEHAATVQRVRNPFVTGNKAVDVGGSSCRRHRNNKGSNTAKP